MCFVIIYIVKINKKNIDIKRKKWFIIYGFFEIVKFNEGGELKGSLSMSF